MLVLLWLLGISLTRNVVFGLPIGAQEGKLLKESEVKPVLSPVVHAAVLYMPKNGSSAREGNGGRGVVEGMRGQFSKVWNTSVSGSRVMSLGNGTGMWNSTVRVLNSGVASTPADVGVHEGGVRGLMKRVSSSVKNVVFKNKGGNDYQVVMRNESKVVARVGRNGKWIRLRKVVPKEGYVIVGVELIKDGNEKTRESREYKIKTGGKDKVDVEDVHLVEDEAWVDIIIGRRLKREDECLMKGGDKEIGGMICRCEKKHGVNTNGGVGCVTRIAERVMRAANEAMLCKEKDEVGAVYKCMIRKLEGRKEGIFDQKGTGRWILSLRGEEDGEVVSRYGLMVAVMNAMKYWGLIIGIGLAVMCLCDLFEQYRLYRLSLQQRGRWWTKQTSL